MNIQDRKKTLTVEELRRRYNLDSLDKDRKAIKIAKEQLNKVDSELNNFVEITTKNIKELQDQVDGNITTWFFNGVPTLNNEPANSWTTDEDKINHLGDLYYDQDTGYAYRWAVESNIYSWSKIVDADVVEALAVANSAQDTADSKRRVFVTNPIPPYDIGDIWIKDDQDLYRCRASRKSGTMNIADWILATKYTDDTVALGTKAELDQFKTEVTKNYVTNATLETTASSISGRVEETYTYVTNVEHQVNDITTTTQTSTGGNSLYITDSLESNALEYHIDGKSEQETSKQGKNLLHIPNQTLTVAASMNITVKDEVITFNGTWSGDGNYVHIPINLTLEAGTYKISRVTSLSYGIALSLVPYNSTNQTTYSIDGSTMIMTVNSKTTFDYLRSWTNGLGTLENVTQKIQVEVGETATSWEKFIPNSPSPDYPSEIKTIPSIRNLIDDTKMKNGYTISGNDGSIVYDATYINNRFASEQYIEVYEGMTLSTNYRIVNYGLYDDNKTFIKRVQCNTRTITVDEGSYIRIGFVDVNLSSLEGKLIVREGNNADEYVPYGAWAKVKVTGKNKLEPIMRTATVSGITCTNNEDGSFTLNGTATANVNFRLNQSTYNSADNLKTYNGDYTLSCEQLVTGVDFWMMQSGTYLIPLSINVDKKSASANINNMNDVFMYVRVVSGTTLNNLVIKPMLEESPIQTEYEPYKEKEVLIDLNIYDEEGNITGHHELCSIGDTKDNLDIVNGQVVIDKKIDEVVLDGSESDWEKNYASSGVAQFFIPLPNCIAHSKLISTHFINANEENKAYINKYGNLVIINPLSNNTLLTEWKTWLSNNPVTVKYVLAEPKQITLPNTQIPLFEGVNHITLVDDLETTTSIKYYRNTPIAQDYVVQQQLDETNSNLSNTDNKVSQAQSDINDTNTNLNNNYYNKNQIDVMNTSTEQVITQIKNSVEATTSATNLQISILQEQLKNGVTSVKTETGYTFDKDGLKIQKTGSEMSSLLDNDGLVVKRNTTEVLTVRSSGVETENLKVRTYFTIGDNTRVENYKGGTGFFYVGGAS